MNESKVREIAQAVNVELSDKEVAQYLEGFTMPNNRIPREPKAEPALFWFAVVLAITAVSIFLLAI